MIPRWRTHRTGGGPAAGEPFQARLEDELLERHAALYGGRGPEHRSGTPWRRPVALVAAAILLATVALASIPSQLTIGVGEIVTIDLDPGVRAPGHHDLLLQLLDARSGVEQASVSVDSEAEGASHVLLLLFGGQVKADRVRAELERAFPVLGAGRWRVRALEANVPTSLGAVLGHRVFAIDVGRESRASRRQLILDRLTAQGWNAEVSFDSTSGIRVTEVQFHHPLRRP
jgi:hypothetical protein